jgi:hypothetical protein
MAEAKRRLLSSAPREFRDMWYSPQWLTALTR